LPSTRQSAVCIKLLTLRAWRWGNGIDLSGIGTWVVKDRFAHAEATDKKRTRSTTGKRPAGPFVEPTRTSRCRGIRSASRRDYRQSCKDYARRPATGAGQGRQLKPPARELCAAIGETESFRSAQPSPTLASVRTVLHADPAPPKRPKIRSGDDPGHGPRFRNPWRRFDLPI
jgi:hypothetical protein